MIASHAQPYRQLSVRPLTVAIGADIGGGDLLNALFAHCTRSEFTCRFRWSPGTLAIWDNCATIHYAVNDYDGYRRLLYRTTIAGYAPIPAT